MNIIASNCKVHWNTPIFLLEFLHFFATPAFSIKFSTLLLRGSLSKTSFTITFSLVSFSLVSHSKWVLFSTSFAFNKQGKLLFLLIPGWSSNWCAFISCELCADLITLLGAKFIGNLKFNSEIRDKRWGWRRGWSVTSGALEDAPLCCEVGAGDSHHSF